MRAVQRISEFEEVIARSVFEKFLASYLVQRALDLTDTFSMEMSCKRSRYSERGKTKLHRQFQGELAELDLCVSPLPQDQTLFLQHQRKHGCVSGNEGVSIGNHLKCYAKVEFAIDGSCRQV